MTLGCISTIVAHIARSSRFSMTSRSTESTVAIQQYIVAGIDMPFAPVVSWDITGYLNFSRPLSIV